MLKSKNKFAAKLIVLLVTFCVIVTISGCVSSSPKAVEAPISTSTEQTAQATPTSTPEPTPIATPEPTSQNELWKKSLINNLAIVLNDSNNLIDIGATDNIDKDAMRNAYARLEVDANTAIEESRSYNVTSDIQAAKAGYEQFFSDTAQGAHYGKMAMDDLKNGNNEKFRADFASCQSYASKVSPDMDKAISLNKELSVELDVMLLSNPDVNVTRLYQE